MFQGDSRAAPEGRGQGAAARGTRQLLPVPSRAARVLLQLRQTGCAALRNQSPQLGGWSGAPSSASPATQWRPKLPNRDLERSRSPQRTIPAPGAPRLLYTSGPLPATRTTRVAQGFDQGRAGHLSITQSAASTLVLTFEDGRRPNSRNPKYFK